MIEIGLGVLLLAAAVIVLIGAGDTLGLSSIDFFPLLGYGGTGFIVALGSLLIAAGLSRRAMQRRHERRHTLRSARLTTAALLSGACLTMGLLLGPEPFNLVRIRGLPLGYYLAAQGGLIGLVVLAFVWAARQNRIDAEEGAAHE
jgi:putative solute:sodium symporter small subunit